MNRKRLFLFSIIIGLFFFVKLPEPESVYGYACIYDHCQTYHDNPYCNGNYGVGTGVVCCLDQCCASGYYDCWNYDLNCTMCCPVGGGCVSTTCSNCSVSCPSTYPNSSCDTSGGGTCTSTTRSCTKYDNCDDTCGTRTITCYSDPTCSARCVSSGYKYYSSAPSVSTEITGRCNYRYTNCSTALKCYKCREGCGSCTAGTYSSTQPADTYIPGTCVYTASLCGTSTKNCYYDCPEVTCADLPSELGQGAWLDECPGPPETCNVTTRSVPIPRPTNPAPMGGKPYNCDTEDTKTCYYPNNRPDLTDLNIIAVPNDPLDTILGFSSTTHSGKSINNPVKIEATYTDDDGSDDIMALYVWFSTDEINKTFLTPTKLEDLTPQTANNSNFGILIARSYDTGNWEKVYVPHIESGNSTWVEAGDVGDNATIYGSTPDEMVTINNINIVESDDIVKLEMRMGFLDETDDIVNTRMFNLWGSVNDKAGYLPFPDYDDANEIVDSADEYWVDPGNDWNLDMVEPETADIDSTIVDTEYKQITITISAEDDDELSYVRLDACKNGYDDGEDLTGADGTPYPLSKCSDVEEDDGNYRVDNITTEDSLLGNVGSFPDPFDEEEFVIGLGENKEGSLTFYFTVMDVAGNNNYDNQDSETYLLEQWAVVHDGLVFGGDGVNSNTRTLTNTSWDGHSILGPFDELKADLTNQVLLGGTNTGNLVLNLKLLAKTDILLGGNKSFKAMNYPGLLISSVYAELTEAYESKSSNSSFEEHGLSGDAISGTLSDPNNDGTPDCSSDYCIWTWIADDPEVDKLTIGTDGTDFECNGKGLIIANGDVVLNPNFTNRDTEDACIILSNGNITITDGDLGLGSPVAYDTVEAFLIADGYIEIPGGGGATPDDEGLFVQGGLVGFTPESTNNSSVYNTREIIFGNMGTYPVLVVQGNSKYGLLSRTLFGSQVDIFKSEVGFKPY